MFIHISQQGLAHGSVIYCRLQQQKEIHHGNISSITAGSVTCCVLKAVGQLLEIPVVLI